MRAFLVAINGLSAIVHEHDVERAEWTLIVYGLKKEECKVVTNQRNRGRHMFPVIKDYEGWPVSKQVVRAALCYIDYVNRTVWERIHG
jgi:UDP-N-acetylglucosamine 2-epimerase (non-hydrolysing)